MEWCPLKIRCQQSNELIHVKFLSFRPVAEPVEFLWFEQNLGGGGYEVESTEN